MALLRPPPAATPATSGSTTPWPGPWTGCGRRRARRRCGTTRPPGALRPETAHELAHLLERWAAAREAEAVFRDLVGIAGRRTRRHLGCLASHLKERGRAAEAAPILDRAVAAAREAIRLQARRRRRPTTTSASP